MESNNAKSDNMDELCEVERKMLFFFRSRSNEMTITTLVSDFAAARYMITKPSVTGLTFCRPIQKYPSIFW